MKTIITLKSKFDSVELVRQLKSNIEFYNKYIPFIYIRQLEITLKGDFTVSYTGLSFWIENEEDVILRFPVELVKEMNIKEGE